MTGKWHARLSDALNRFDAEEAARLSREVHASKDEGEDLTVSEWLLLRRLDAKLRDVSQE